uniref:Putative portal protein n=1 Tax=viral metagenome TaxID=1070528 RepID=A0A6M3INP7_9ZZZZ
MPRVKVVAEETKKKPEVNNSDSDDTLLKHIDSLMEESSSQTSNWSSNQEKWQKLRMRIKKVKTFPFPNCSNIRIPTAEIKIRKLKAALYNVIFGIRPVVNVAPSPSGNMGTARKIEKFLDHLIMDVIKLHKKAIIAIDQELEKGFFLLKPYWNTQIINRVEEFKLDDISLQEATQLFSAQTSPEQVKQAIIEKLEVDMSEKVAEENGVEIDRIVKEVLSGKDKVKINLQDVICDYPDVALADPERIYVPSDAGVDPQELQFIVHEFFLPLNQVKKNSETKGWSKLSVEDIEDMKDVDIDTDTDTQKNTREGIERLNNPSNLVMIWEFYGYYDLNDDGVDEKCVITIAPDFNKVLRKITIPFDSTKYPFVKLAYEYTSDRWFSHRGIPEILEDIIKEIDTQHMQKIDNQTIRNAPMFTYRAGMVNPNLVKFIPGQGIPVQGMNPLNDSLAVLNNTNPNAEFSYEREQMSLQAQVEELIGQVDFTLQSMINKRQPRTFGEVQMQQQNMQSVFSLDASMHTEAFSDLFTWIWDLWCQYGNDEYEFAYFGKQGWEKIRLTREEVQGHYKVTVRGNDQNTNPQVRLQKAQMVMMAVQNPIALQTGVVKPWHLAEAYDLLFKELDLPDAQRLHEDPQQLLQQAQQAMQQPQPLPIKLQLKDMEDGEKAQVLQRAGIQPDMKGRELKSRAIIQEKSIEQEKEKVGNLREIVSMISDLEEKEEEPSGESGTD